MSSHMKVDWINGCISLKQTDRKHQDKEVSIIFVGDLSTTGCFKKPMSEGRTTKVYGNTLKEILSADYRIFNLETILSQRGSPIDKAGANLFSLPETINGIAKGGFNLACLANNHILDYGKTAASDTVKLLKEHGIKYTGVGDNSIEASKPYIFSIKNQRFAVFNCAEAEESAATDSRFGACDFSMINMKKNISDIKENVDHVIVSIHAGKEYTPVPSPRLYSLYLDFVNAGADLIVGHHPHVPQGIKIVNNSLIAFSLGNFIFHISKRTAKNYKYSSKGYMLKVTFAKRSLTKIELIPYKIIQGKGIELLSVNEKKQFLQLLKELSAILKEKQFVEQYWEIFCNAMLEERLFPVFAGALLNSYSQGKMIRKLKYLRILINRLFLRWKKQADDTATALNCLTSPTLSELMIDSLKYTRKKIYRNETIVRLLKEWGYRF